MCISQGIWKTQHRFGHSATGAELNRKEDVREGPCSPVPNGTALSHPFGGFGTGC